MGDPVTAFCAICTGPITGPPARLPLGRDDALVSVCASCNVEPARARSGPSIAYEVPGDDVGRGTLRERFAAAADRVAGKRGPYRGASTKPAQPGWIVVRVGMRNAAGHPIDAAEALHSLRHMPWHGLLQRLGTNERWHVFERPDSAAAARQRSGDPLADALALLEQYRVSAKGVARPA